MVGSKCSDVGSKTSLPSQTIDVGVCGSADLHTVVNSVCEVIGGAQEAPVAQSARVASAAINNLVDQQFKHNKSGRKGRSKNRSKALRGQAHATQPRIDSVLHQVSAGIESSLPEVSVQQTLRTAWINQDSPIDHSGEDLSYLLPWGDTLADRDDSKTMRVVYQNVAHSFAATGDDPRVSSFTENLSDLGAGMAMCSETNVNWRSTSNTMRVRRILQKTFRVQMSTNSSDIGDTPEALSRRKLPGGSAIFTFDHWASTVVDHGYDSTGKGWFCYTTLEGKNKKKLTCICYYRSCKPTATTGASTAHSQAATLLDNDIIEGERSAKSTISPREASVKELCVFILAKIAEGHSILLAGDGNETPGESVTAKGVRQFSMEWLFQETGLEDVFLQRHGARPSTTTTTNGRYIDWVGVWQVPLLGVARLGEHMPALSDHLAIAVDVDMETLFGGKYDALSGVQFRKLSVKNRKSRQRYEADILKQWDAHKILERAIDIHSISLTDDFMDRDMVTLNRLDKQVTEIVLGAANRCSTKVLSRDPWSPSLKFCGKVIVYWRARLYARTCDAVDHRSITRLQRQAEIPEDIHRRPFTKKEIKAFLREAWKKHREARKEAEEWRDEHLAGRAADLMDRMQIAEEKAVKLVRHHEASRRRFGRIRRVMGKAKKGLTQITITDPETGEHRVLTKKADIDEAILRRNEKHLQEPNETPFGSYGRLHNMVVPGSGGNQVEAMLEGTAQVPEGAEVHPVMLKWIAELQRRNYADIDITLTPEDFRYGMKGVRESTASSPSGRHVGHYLVMAMMESDVVRRTICLIAEASIRARRPLDRWLQCTQVMLEKGKGNHIDNLRIIQLLEADLNFVLRLIWGRRLNRAAHGQGHYDTSQYAVPGMVCNSAVLQKVLFVDLLRQTHQAGAITEFDVKAAYDQVIPALAAVTCRRLGLPASACDFMTNLIGNMEYRVGTARGVSEGSFKASDNASSPGQGTMQGSGSSPTIFLGVTDVSLRTQKEVATPAMFSHPAQDVAPVVSYAVQFVDDNGQECSEQGLSIHLSAQLEACDSEEAKIQLLVQAVNDNAASWGNLQWVYGGVFNASKCYWYLIKSVLCPKTGKVTYKNARQIPAELLIPHPEGKEPVAPAKRYEAHEANRTLGVQWAPDGNVKKEVHVGLGKAKAWAKSLRRSQLSNMDWWVAYNSCVKPALLYPQVPQQCEVADLEGIQSEVDGIVCNALGLNVHFPRALLHGPMELGGVGVPSLWAEALADKIVYFLYHIRRKDEVGRQLHTSIAITQLELGIGTPFFETDYEQWGHLVTLSWAVHLWKSCSRVGVKLKSGSEFHWVPPLQTLNDRYIMDIAAVRFSKKNCIKINYCRRFLKVTTLSDLAQHDGTRLHPDIAQCRAITGRTANYNWPQLPTPPRCCIKAWKRFINLCFPTGCVAELEHDEWRVLPSYSHELDYYFHPLSGDVFRVAGDELIRHPSISRRANRHRLGLCSGDGEFYEGARPAGGVFVDVEQTRRGLVILGQSLREAQAVRAHHGGIGEAELQDMSFRDRLAALPDVLKGLVGSVTLPADEGRSIVNLWEAGQDVLCVSDGSAKNGQATQAWKICAGAGDPLAIFGAGPVDGVSPTAVWAEAQGQLSILIVSTLLAQSAGLHRSKIISICDNIGTVRRLATQHRLDRMQGHKAADSDLYLLYKAWLRKGGVECAHEWIKGHQDRGKRIEDLAEKARINVEVDRLAGEAYERPDCDRTILEIPVFEEEEYAVFTAEGKVVSQVRPAVIRQCEAEEMSKYQREKHGLSEGKAAGIDWGGLHGFLRRQSPQQRAAHVKCQNGWLPTQEFLWRQKRAESDLCPLCGTESETFAHIYRCCSPVAVTYRVDQVRKFALGLKLAGTATEIVNCWISQLGLLFPGVDFTPYYVHPTNIHKEVNAAVAVARRHQSVLSWEGFLQGRLSVEWDKVQNLHERRRGLQCGVVRQVPWIVKAFDLVCDLVPALWKFRNEEVHGRTLAEKALKERDRVHKRVRKIYSDAPDLLPRYPSVQAVPVEERLQKPTFVLQLWLRQVARQRQVTEMVRRKSEERQKSIEPFLVKRGPRSEGASGRSASGPDVFDRGR